MSGCPTIKRVARQLSPKSKIDANNDDSRGNQDGEPSPEGGEANIAVILVSLLLVAASLLVLSFMFSYPRYFAHIGFAYGAVCGGLAIWLLYSRRQKTIKKDDNKNQNSYYKQVQNTTNNDRKVVLSPSHVTKDHAEETGSNKDDGDDSEDDYDSLHNRPPRGES
jgi:predicted phage tail protein